MSKRIDWGSVAAAVVALALIGAMGYCIFMMGKILFWDRPAALHACQDALAAADARYALSESTTALVFDQWRADNLGDAHGVEYAKSGIQQNTEEIDALTTDYNELKEACK